MTLGAPARAALLLKLADVEQATEACDARAKSLEARERKVEDLDIKVGLGRLAVWLLPSILDVWSECPACRTCLICRFIRVLPGVQLAEKARVQGERDKWLDEQEKKAEDKARKLATRLAKAEEKLKDLGERELAVAAQEGGQ